MIDPHTLEKLEFGVVREMLAERCSNRLGRSLALRVAPSQSFQEVQRWLGLVRELLAVAGSPLGLPPLGGVRDISEALVQTGRPSGIDSEQLAEVADTLETTGLICLWSAKLPDHAELLRSLTARVGDFTPIARQIQQAIDTRGAVRDHASPKLANIRAAISKARDQIDLVFKRLLRQSSITRFLQYASATFHDDRRVLPLKADHRGRVPGIVHRSSDSGATLFVEPAEAVELNNSIVRMGLDEHKEVNRILGDLSRLVHMNAAEIQKTLNALAVLDLQTAKVRYARDFDARVPELEDVEIPVLDLRQARHPALEQLFRHKTASDGLTRNVVPIDVRLGEDFDLLVITGPNTGGKTVALKTIGLLVLMAQAGIPIPVAGGSKVSIYAQIFADIGDEQSIEQSLSTFSSHLANMLDILRRANKRSLVLIDEMGAGTDPDEGAAIGRAVMEELLRLGASAIVTTHLSALKAVAFIEPRVDNASVEFDPLTLQPLYRLRLGEPGNSNALIIAERLGMPRNIINRARSHLDQRQQTLKKAIAGTLESRRESERARIEAQEAKRRAEHERFELERRQSELIEQQIAHQKWVSWINRLSPGDDVYVRSFDRIGRVVRVQLQQQTAVVAAGAMELEVRLSELALPTDPAHG